MSGGFAEVGRYLRPWILATVPHSGTHAVVVLFGLKFMKTPDRAGAVAEGGEKFPRCGLWCHVSKSNTGYLLDASADVFTTWRDPLRVAVSWVYKPMSGTLEPGMLKAYYENLLLLRRSRPVAFLRMDTLPRAYRNDRVTRPEVLRAYEERDLKRIGALMGPWLETLREIDWGDFPRESWWS